MAPYHFLCDAGNGCNLGGDGFFGLLQLLEGRASTENATILPLSEGHHG